ncbi:MAG: tail fiber protein [Myxococcota bacterium]
MFAGNFAPRGWALCNGQLLAISSHSALFSILGTTYGGDGVSTFGLPEMRGRVAIHEGTGPGLTPRQLGQKTGHETETLTTNQMPSHTHGLFAYGNLGTDQRATGNVLAANAAAIYDPGPATEQMGTSSVGHVGANQPVNIMQPFLALNFIIALEGLYPSRS